MRLTVIADDLTGALDTGVQFANTQVQVAVVLGAEYIESREDSFEADVVVVDAEVRHVTPERTYEICSAVAARAMDNGTDILYIKTDSGLRGNIGAMMQAALDKAETGFAAFAPALPGMNRITRGGIQYVDGQPISESVFGKDPFEPVRASRVSDLFAECRAAVREYPLGGRYRTTELEETTIGVFDAEREEDLLAVAEHLKTTGQFRVLGGCAGFAAALRSCLGMDAPPAPRPCLDAPLLVVCGSLNPITKRQLDYAAGCGSIRVSLNPHQLREGYFDTPESGEFLAQLERLMRGGRDILIDTLGDDGKCARTLRDTTARQLGILVKRLLESRASRWYLPMVIGGDTLLGAIQQLPCSAIRPRGEAAPGVVLFEVPLSAEESRWMLSKSGGFGQEDLFAEIRRNMNGGKTG